MNSKLKRFGVAIPQELLVKFDKFIKERKYKNRSEAIRDLIRAEFVKKSWELNQQIVGVISIVYNHHKRELVDKIVDIQHEFQDMIVASQHIHLDSENCLEVILTRGKGQDVQTLKDRLAAVKGVLHATLSVTAVV